MTVYFNYGQVLTNAYIDNGADYYQSPYVKNPDGEVVFQTRINPGHGGSISVIDWYIYFQIGADQADTVAWSIDYRESGGSWTALDNGNSVHSGAGTESVFSKGVTTGLSLDIPLDLRITLTDAAGDTTYSINFPHSSSYSDQYHCIKIFGSI